MREFTHEIGKNGLDAHAAAKIVLKGELYHSSIQIGRDGESLMDGKSLVGLIAMLGKKGDVLRVRIEGEDEIVAENGIKSVLQEVL